MSKILTPNFIVEESKLPFSLLWVNHYHEQEHIIREKGLPYYQWVQCIEGEGELIINGETTRVLKNQGMFLLPNETHEYYSITQSWKVAYVCFNGYNIDSVFENLGINNTKVYFISNSEIMISKIKHLTSLWKPADPMSILDCSILVYDFIIALKKYISISESHSTINRYLRLKPVFDYIEANYQKTIVLDELSNLIGVTPQHLCVIFKKTMNIRVFEYINNVRIQKSKELMILNGNNMCIKDIAKQVGFYDYSYFTTLFKKLERVSPKNFCSNF